MRGRDYIPIGSKADKEWREELRRIDAEQAQRDAEYNERQRQRRDDAAEALLTTIAELAELDIPTQHFEVVRPLGRLATIGRSLNPFKRSQIIRADTIRKDFKSFEYAERHAELTPAEGYLLPTTEGSYPEFGQALFTDGTTGRTMNWQDFLKPGTGMIYFGRIPPRELYWCDPHEKAKFSLKNRGDRFEERNCTPVWAESVVPLSAREDALSIEALTERARILMTITEAEQVITDSSE